MITSRSYDMTPCGLVQRYVQKVPPKLWVRSVGHQITQGGGVIDLIFFFLSSERHFVCSEDETVACVIMEQSRTNGGLL